MGILDELEAERDRRAADMPEPWEGSEDKLEEWLGLVPEGTMPDRKKKARAQLIQDKLIIELKLAKHPSDIYKPSDFRSHPQDYARALKMQAHRTPKGYYPGYIITFVLGGIKHVRRIAEPVKDKAQAYSSTEFVLAVTKAMQVITSHKLFNK